MTELMVGFIILVVGHSILDTHKLADLQVQITMSISTRVTPLMETCILYTKISTENSLPSQEYFLAPQI
jgi:hypothetical protein